MQILYDKLYRALDYNALPVRDYFPSLIDEIMSNFSEYAHIKIETDIEDFMMETGKLQPMGIIINELLTNIMKYAFIGRPDGSIAISARLHEDIVTLTIADNGHGMPESVDFDHSTGFGLLLVKGLTQQLGGTIRMERGLGTKIVLECKR